MRSTQMVVYMPRQHFERLHELVRKQDELETGGVIIGYWTTHGDCVITSLCGPAAGSRRNRSEFVPDTGYHQRVVDSHFDLTSGAATYLGEWHTHPSGELRPSRQDRKTMQYIGQRLPRGSPRPILVIVRRETTLEVAAFRTDAKSFGKAAAIRAVDARALPKAVWPSLRWRGP